MNMANPWTRSFLIVAVWLSTCLSARAQTDTGTGIHLGAEYLLWYSRPQIFSQLVTTGSITDQTPAALGQPNTQVLLNGKDSPGSMQSGFRVTLGVGIDADQFDAMDASFFLLGEATGSRIFASDGSDGTAVLGRPFFNNVTGAEDTDPTAIPNISSGKIEVTTSRRFYGGDFDYRYQYYNSEGNRLSLLFGARYLSLEDSLGIHVTSTDLPSVDELGNPVTGNSYSFREAYHTRNRFVGGQIGAEYGLRVGPVMLLTTGKLAIGATNQVYTSSAFSSVTDATGLVTTSPDRALYLAPGNVGRFETTRFAVAPEANLKFVVDMNENLRFTVGYTLIAISSVARATDQIDRNVTVQPIGFVDTFAPTPQTPHIRTNNFWAQGLDAGIRFSF